MGMETGTGMESRMVMGMDDNSNGNGDKEYE